MRSDWSWHQRGLISLTTWVRIPPPLRKKSWDWARQSPPAYTPDGIAGSNPAPWLLAVRLAQVVGRPTRRSEGTGFDSRSERKVSDDAPSNPDSVWVALEVVGDRAVRDSGSGCWPRPVDQAPGRSQAQRSGTGLASKAGLARFNTSAACAGLRWDRSQVGPHAAAGETSVRDRAAPLDGEVAQRSEHRAHPASAGRRGRTSVRIRPSPSVTIDQEVITVFPDEAWEW
jgi:hypothetical protein